MRLWSLHPRHLDRQGLTALWREALLAQAVLAGRTKGYRHHPQLDRFRDTTDPLGAIGTYLSGVADEAERRGYRYDRDRIARTADDATIQVTTGQVEHEWDHLRQKLAARSPEVLAALPPAPDCHPMLRVVPGPVADWERAPAPVAGGAA